MTKICVNMIVKNEEDIIERCLTSLLPIAQSWVICDTGSSDKTKDIIRGFMESRGLNYVLADTKFETWDQARNDALVLARTHCEDIEYILVCDADMELVITDPLAFDGLVCACYGMIQKTDILSYHNIRLVRVDAESRYVGVTHEYLSVNGTQGNLEGVHFKDYANGSNRSDKLERDISLLKGGMEDGLFLRYMFYLANSYRDRGQNKQAVAWYTSRSDCDGWFEEKWISMYYAGQCCLALNQLPEFVEWMEKAISFNPKRAEPYAALAEQYRAEGKHKLAYETAKSVPSDMPDGLFIERRAYTYLPLLTISISGFYAKTGTSVEEAREACYELLTMNDLPEHYDNLNRTNIIFQLQGVGYVFPGAFILNECHPPTVIKAEPSVTVPVIKKTESEINMRSWKGSSPAVPYDGGWIFAVQESVEREGQRVNWHRLVWMNENSDIQKYTNPFVFAQVGAEYCVGIVIHGDKFLLTFGLEDRNATFCEIPISSVEMKWKNV